ncbi:MAG: translation elongation factor Ts [Candidatus Kapabacteria bacterium]|jgi:elongation factor Ts|nr:translation elongation factor Ts [Candidatus Kapabacteria bacterium]
MGQITPQLVKDLRVKTGAGMGDCKKALVESNGDLQEAIDFLRKKGAASMAKRADRAAKEGMVIARTDKNGKNAVIVEINCETDFVALNEAFVTYCGIVADAIENNDVKSVEDLLKISVDGDSIEELHNDILAKFSEKIESRRFKKLATEGVFSTYNHSNNKLGVLVEMSTDGLGEPSKALVHDITMQIAAMNPLYISKEDVPQTDIDKEIEIYNDAAVLEGKKPELAERIATGKIAKFYKDQCLVQQVYVKDSGKTIADVVKEISDDSGKEVSVKSFSRFMFGESLD